MPNRDLTLLRGTAQNLQYFPTIDSVIFSASKWERHGISSECIGHAMLHPILPGYSWPSTLFKPGTTMPVELSHVYTMAGYRKKGLGTRLVNETLSYARRRGWRVVLRVTPYGRGGGMDENTLVRWYGDLDFVLAGRVDSIAYMVSER